MKYFLILCFISIHSIGVLAQTLTFSEDIAEIIFNQCTRCHHTGGGAPFPLETYSDVSTNIAAIQIEVSSGSMPPWTPDTTYQRYVDERILTIQEKNDIINWINNSAPEGDPALTPPVPQYSQYLLSGTPDLELQLPTYTSKATAINDDYVCFAIPSGLLQKRYIRAFEIVPGNPSIVHHVVMVEDTLGIAQTDTSGNCSTPMGQIGLGGYAPGSMPVLFPESTKMGIPLYANSTVVVQVHYPKGSGGQQDNSRIRFYFYPDTVTNIREVYSWTPLQKWSWCISPNTTETYNVQANNPYLISLFSTFPHMHLLGKSVELYALDPLGDTLPLINIKDWDFDWQQYYTFKKMIKLPAGSNFYSVTSYDNTVNNPHNPFSPPQTICAGLQTTDEMLFHSFQYVMYQPGDENINMDSLLINDPLLVKPTTGVDNSSTKDFSLGVFPNPFSDRVVFEYDLPENAKIRLTIYDVYGRSVDKIEQVQVRGKNKIVWNSSNNRQAKSGVYFYTIEMGKNIIRGKIVSL